MATTGNAADRPDRPIPVQSSFMRHTISVQVENKPGVLAWISGLFASRNFNI